MIIFIQFFQSKSVFILILFLIINLKIDTLLSMQKASNCLGCRTFFEEAETLPLECLTVQYKNFTIPLQEQKHKWSLLKTIVSFLNTKGGFIYIGVEDSNCKIVGKQLTSKIRDEFKLYLSQLTERIFPQVDLNNKEEISVQYVPVVKNKVFSGKYITKIIVKQGDPSQTYCFTQKLLFAKEQQKEKVDENSCQNIQIPYAFVRHNMGGIRELKGVKLIEEAIKKAQNPPPRFNTFHEECNPEPSQLQIETKKIGFKNFANRESRRSFERLCKGYLQSLNGQFEISFDQQLKAIVIELATVEQFKRINNFIESNLSQLNESQGDVRFVDCGDYLGIHFYENTLNSNEQNGSPKKQTKKEGLPQKNTNKKQEKKQEDKKEQKKQTADIQPKVTKKNNEQGQIVLKNEQPYSLTFTHINPHLRDKLINYLTFSLSKKIEVICKEYINTVEVIFNSKEDMEKYSKNCFQNNNFKALQNFGFNKEIRIGKNTGHLHILNFDFNKGNKLRSFLQVLMGNDLVDNQVLKKGNRHIVDCRMISNSRAAQWLDKLLINKLLKQFSIPGAQNGMVAKLKIFLYCEQTQGK